MIIISLDEQGHFESENKEPMFIAGLIFDDLNDEKEEKIERQRIEAYYTAVMNNLGSGFSYPNDLHSDGDKVRDKNVIRPVKEMIRNTFSEFISKGTVNGQTLRKNNENHSQFSERKGVYHIFVMLKSDDGKKALLSDKANMLVKDNYAANLYINMASSVVNRLIFHNPIYANAQMPEIKLDLASRASADVSDISERKKKEFSKIGYLPEKEPREHYRIINRDIYRTLISQEMLNSNKSTIKINSFYVQSINYNTGSKKQEFLYLSDSICSILGYELQNKNNPEEGADDWLNRIVDRVNEMNPSNVNLVFGYDEIDNEFDQAWKCFENRDSYNALSITYDAKNRVGKFAEYYKKTWFPYVEERVVATVNPGGFAKDVNDLSSKLNVNNLNQDKLKYMMEMYEKIAQRVEKQFISIDSLNPLLYKLYDIGISAYCHIGDAKKALQYYEKCKKYAFFTGVDAFLKTNNKFVESLCDCFEFNYALQIAKDTVEYQGMTSEIKREILADNINDSYQDDAKAISQLARVYACKRDGEAENKFREALAMCRKGTANYKITQSYLLHFYADNEMQEEFEREATDYFEGNKTYNQRLKFVLDIDETDYSLFSKKYALCVLVRGMYAFGMNQIDNKLWEKICNIHHNMEKSNENITKGHPWEIINKYLVLIALKMNDLKMSNYFNDKKRNCMGAKGAIIYALDMYGDAEIYNSMIKIEERDGVTKELADYLKKEFSALKDVRFDEDGEKRYSELTEYFTFMYR